MKIEKINDNQIRCLLTKEDLAERHIRISELAYGSDKARRLFQDMMQQAYNEYGFSNEGNIPLMIEAIPGSGSTLTIVITKVEDPEELDTRFAKFSPTDEVPDEPADAGLEGADEILDLLHNIMEKRAAGENGLGKDSALSSGGAAVTGLSGSAEGAENASRNNAGRAPESARANGASPQEPSHAQPGVPSKPPVKAQVPKKNPRGKSRNGTKAEFPKLTRAYLFKDLDHVIRAAGVLGGVYDGVNTLYHMNGRNEYLLTLHQSTLTPEDFNKVCNILSEYGTGENFTATQEAYLREHSESVIEGKALQKLLQLA